MSKTVDVDLRIRAKNLSKATLTEITDDVDRLTRSQKEQASAANLAAKSAKELTAAQQYLAAAERELSRRAGLGDRYKNEQTQIAALAEKIRELTAARAKAAADGAKAGALGSMDREIARTNKQMDSLVQKNEATGASLRGLGVDVDKLDAELGGLRGAVEAAGRAKAQAVADVQRYGAAVEHNNAVIAEAARLQREEAAVQARRNNAATQIAVGDANRRVELAAMREAITKSLELGRQKEIEAEATRRLAAETEQETSTRLRGITAVVQQKNRLEELAALRRDIIARSAQGNAAEERSNRILAEGEARRDRLIRLLNTERGQRILAAEAARRGTADLNANSSAADRNAGATGRAAKAQGLFNDTGRKSLGTYQRVRGQVLGLITAYVGVYEAINTVRKAVDATNRDQSLRIGLRVGSGGDAEIAAKNYTMLRKEADRLGLVFDDVAPKFVNLDIAGRAAGLNARQTAQAFKDLSVSVSARNLSLDDTEGAFRAIEQMFSKGKVQAEELRGQLAERLPGAVAIFAKASGKSLAQLDKDLEQGRIGLDFVVRGLRAYAAQFDGEMGSITERLSAYINRAKNAYNDWLRTLMNGDNQNRLKQALSVVTTFFQSNEGAEFAQALGTAFAKLIEVFLWLAKNIDTVTTAMKLFIGVQVLKFFADIVTSAHDTAKALVAFRVAVAAATAQTGAMGVAARGLTAVLGPAGVALAALGGGFYAYSAGVEAAERRTQQFINTLSKARKAQGVDEISRSASDLSRELAETESRMGDLVKARDNLVSINPLKSAGAAITAIKNDLYTLQELNLAIQTQEQKRAAIMQQQVNTQKMLNKAKAADADEARNAANDPLPSIAEKAAKTPKAAKGPDPDSVRDRVLKMTEDLTAKLAQTEVQANVRTMDQIEANYNARLAVIKTEIAKAEIDIAAMQRAAAASNKGNGTDLTTELTTLRGALDAYREAANERAEEDRVTAQITLKQREINDLVDARRDKLELINTLQENGAITVGEAWKQTSMTTEAMNEQIRTSVESFIALLQNMDPTTDLYARLGIAKTIAGLQQIQAEAAKANSIVKQVGLSMANDLAGGAADALVTLGQGLAGAVEGANSMSDAFKGAMDAFRNFAADFLQRIAQMIIQALILQAIQNAINGSSGGYGQAIGAAFGAASRHQGGIAGGPNGSNPVRRISPQQFASSYAGKFHGGGLPGLKPNEVTAVLEKGEEVVTEDNPRHIANYQGQQPVASPIQNNIMFDTVEVVQNALARPAGQKALMTFIKANKSGVKAILGN